MSLIADGSKLTPSVEQAAQKAGDAGAKTLSQRMSAGLKTNGIKALGTAFAAAGAIATTGALQMEDAVARIRSETGATADEAERIAKTSNQIAGDQQQSLQAVTDVAIAVRKDMGLTGDALDKVTDQTVKYARVTKQDGAGAVKALDDIGDAWNLTANQILDVQDQLLVSNQKWGGSITENQDALAKMAPQLQALGVDVNGGIALLNLFAASGVDSSKAMTALNTAVKNLKPGQTLDDLIRQVSAIEDPTKRAQKAIELFGAKGGVALANVLKPGINSLDDFGVSAQDSAGAVDKSVDDLDSSLGAKLRKVVSQAKATLRGFGADFGPAVTGIASLASLATTILPKGTIQKIGKRIGVGLADAIVGSFKSAQIGVRLESLGLQLQTLWIKGMTKVGDPLAAAIGDAIDGVKSSPRVTAATNAAGKVMGSTLGKAFAVGFAAVAIVELAKEMVEFHDQALQHAKDLTNDLNAFVAQATRAQLEDQLQKVKDAQAKLVLLASIPGGHALLGDTINELDSQESIIKAKLDAMDHAISEATDHTATQMDALGHVIPSAATAGVQAGAPSVTQATVSMVDDATAAAGYAANKKAYELGQGVSKQTAQGMLDAQTSVHDAFHSFLDIIKNALSPAKEQARLLGNLTSRKLREGLQSGNPIVRKAAEEMQTQILDRLTELAAQGKPLGKDAAQSVANGLKSKSPEVRAQAQLLAKIMADQLARSKGPAGNAGENAGEAYANRLRAAIARQMAVAINVRAHFNTTFDNGHGHAIGGWAPAGVPTWVNEHTNNSEMWVPSQSGRFLTHADAVQAIAAAAGGGGDTYQIPVTVQGALPVRTARDIALEVRRAGQLGKPPPRELAPMYPRREAATP